MSILDSRDSQVAIRGAARADSIRDILAPEVQLLLPGVVVSITRVTLSPDQKRCSVWLRYFPSEVGEKSHRSLSRHASKLQAILSKAYKARRAPRIQLEHDLSIEGAEALEKLLL